jgi:hypothetical protein
MISSIVLTDCHNVQINNSNKIKVDEQILSVEKDIPFVRYRFKSYGDKEISYIKDMKSKFTHSAHLAEVYINGNTVETFRILTEEVGNIARYLYIDITDSDVRAKNLSNEVKDIIKQVKGYKPDRIMLRDKSTTLDMISFKSLAKMIRQEIDYPESNIGLCSSPLSFSELACLTAVKARELMSVYCDTTDVALPSANHQCMNCCGCIRYLLVDKDTEMVAESKGKKDKKEKTVSKDAISVDDFIGNMAITESEPNKKTKEKKSKEAKPNKKNKTPFIQMI